MASNQFKEALQKARQTKDLNTFVQGDNAKYLKEGEHDVTIVGVDTAASSDNRITFTLENSDGKQYTHRAFLMSREGDLNYAVRAILGATIPNLEALDKFLDELSNHDISAFEMLTGMRMRVTLGFGKGYSIRASVNGKYVISDTGVVASDEFDKYEDAKKEAEAKGIKKAYLNVTKTEATSGPANIANLEFALSAVKRKREGSPQTGTVFVAGV